MNSRTRLGISVLAGVLVLGWADAGSVVVADVGKASPLGRINAKERATNAALAEMILNPGR